LSAGLARANVPITSFAEFGLPDRMSEVLLQRGITQPLPIQAAAIADVLAGRDVSGKAPTGSGKTLAFALPIAATLKRSTPKRPRALVLAPTRELAGQIATEMGPLLATRSLKAYPFYGGVGFGGQRNALRRGVDVAVACPGRLEDLMSTGDINLSNVDVVVVDEADRMADMGFLPAVCRILDATPSECQTLLFSATLDGDVDVLVRRYQRNPVRHDVATEEEVSRASHEFRPVANADRAALCAELVRASGSSMVFVRTKRGADRVAKRLRDSGAAAAAIHGDRSQAQRERTLMEFRAGKVQTLVATDVAARGIHVDDVARVIHYDLPADIKDYVHRSGRTARAGAEGTVISFVTPDNRALADTLQRGLRQSEQGGRGVAYADDSGRATPDIRAEELRGRGVRRDAQGRHRRREVHPGQGAARFNGPARQGRAGARRPAKPRG
jgi:superfamily II DNA/RNA helicase